MTAEREGGLGGLRENGEPIRPRERALADEQHRPLLFGRRVVDETRQSLRAGAKIIILISQIGFLADDADEKIAFEPALADARIENRRFLARIRADDHDAHRPRRCRRRSD